MAQKSGFYNAMIVNGSPDRSYNADDYSKCLKTVISNGVLRSENDDYKVTASGMELTVGVGFAMIEGRYANNDTPYRITVPTAHNSYSRIDRVVLRHNNNTDTRNTFITYLTGTAAASPVAPEIVRSGNIYDLCLAEISVPAQATSVTVTDKRADTSVCGWLYSVVGGDAFFASLDNEFNAFLQEKKDKLASVTMIKKYNDRIVLDAQSSTVVFDIPQYDPTGTDIVEVFVNGLQEISGEDWTIEDSTITFVKNPKIAGTKIDVFVTKSIDGTGLGSVADEVTRLQNIVAQMDTASDFEYHCTGTNDNIALSQLAESFLTGADDGGVLCIKVYGEMGVGAAYSGTGASSSRYKYFALGLNSNTSRRIIFDFANCSTITVDCADATHNIIFFGTNVHVKNAHVIVNCASSSGSAVVFSSTTGEVLAEDCRFEINGYTNCHIAETGTFTRCFGKVVNTYNGFCFNVSTNGLLKLFGGEYYAYVKSSTANDAVVYIAESATRAAAVLFGVNCPISEISGAYQNYAVRQLAGHAMCFGTITALVIDKLENSTNTGQINRTKIGTL